MPVASVFVKMTILYCRSLVGHSLPYSVYKWTYFLRKKNKCKQQRDLILVHVTSPSKKYFSWDEFFVCYNQLFIRNSDFFRVRKVETEIDGWWPPKRNLIPEEVNDSTSCTFWKLAIFRFIFASSLHHGAIIFNPRCTFRSHVCSIHLKKRRSHTFSLSFSLIKYLATLTYT